MPTVRPVVLCGGAGSRLRPLSQPHRPKPLLPLGPRGGTLLGETLERLCHPAFQPPWLVCGQAHAAAMSPPDGEGTVLVEPTPRGTAPAIFAAAALAGEGLVLALPADHYVASPAAFHEAVMSGVEEAQKGRIVALGVAPDRPATGFGWIGKGAALSERVHAIARFEEKPSLARAEELLAGGAHLWNAGMFLFEAAQLLAHAADLQLSWVAQVRASVASATRDGSHLLLDRASFEGCPTVSFDVAVMEQTQRAAVVGVEMGWDDLGTWEAVARHLPTDAAGNAVLGAGMVEGCRDTVVVSDGPRVAARGLDDVLVAATAGQVMVVPRRDHRAVAELPLPELTRRPWGCFAPLDRGHGYQVKRIEVDPGGRTSLQRHRHRAEHWTVVQGRASVLVDDRVHSLGAGESITVPRGAVHRLGNDGNDTLVLIEVQTGPYLEEDDIERFDDDYGRVSLNE